MCKHLGDDPQPMDELILILTSHGNNWETAMNALRNATNNCPVCILAAIRQSGIQKNNTDIDLHFDFKAELANFWREYNYDRENRIGMHL